MPEDATATYCRLACDLIGRNLVDLQQQQPRKMVLLDGVELDLPHRSKYREWFMAMTAQLMDEQHPGFVPSASDTTTSSSSAHEIHSNNIPACNDCGSALQPGFHGSTMRLIRVAAPPRRRQPHTNINNSRGKAADDPLATWKDVATSSSSTPGSTAPQRATKGCRNKMVLICGTCKARTTYPGIPLRSTTTEANHQDKDRRTEKRKLLGAQEKPATKKRTTANTLDDTLDFVPLGGGGGRRDSAKKRLADLTARHNPQTLTKSKKKKKKPSQLFDFLSNLNS